MDFLLAGVGGQGIVLMSDLLAEAALEAGYDVKKSDVFGMAQRGGSVTSYVRIGEKVYSPLPRPGEVDFLVGLEKLEAARWASHLVPGGTAVVNDYSLFPLEVSSGAERYPTDQQVIGSFESRGCRVHLVDGTGMARQLGNPKVLNVAVLGQLASLLPLPWEAWTRTVERRIPARFRELNLRALALGQETARSELRTAD
ncbi:MAG TPA: indolepyruvate oxidoreductase subunit beta [Chloroflexota bacterium]|nr:indolepyruvate oxidoreductase subunit beta [Chloroflexota bacterium]